MGKLVRQLGSIEKNLHKKDIVDLATDNAQAIIDSEKYDLLKVYVELKRYETYLKGPIQHLKHPALNKAAAKGKKSFDYNDARVNISERTMWDFSVDNKWNELDQQIQHLTKKKKEREKYLKENKKVQSFVDKETGEIIDEYELPKEIKPLLRVKL
jgi:hypothetical protein